MASFTHVNWDPLYLEDDKKDYTRLIGIEFEAKVKPLEKMPDENFAFITEEWMNEHTEYNMGEMWEKENPDKKYSSRSDYMETKLANKGIKVGGVGYDGGGKEFVTFPDSYSCYLKGGSQRLKDLVEVLSKYTLADVQSGTHIHVSMLKGDTAKTWDNIYWFCMCYGPQLQKLFGRRSHWATIPLPKGYFQSTEDTTIKLFEKPQKRPKPTNVYSKGSIVVNRENRYEFRGPKASHDLNEILAWAQLCHNIVEVCANGYIKDIPFAEVLKGEYIRAYAHSLEKNQDRILSSAERGMRISDIGFVQVNFRDKKL